jgi:hypothetical protein
VIYSAWFLEASCISGLIFVLFLANSQLSPVRIFLLLCYLFSFLELLICRIV